jgi:lipopolysaccharide export system permease protein
VRNLHREGVLEAWQGMWIAPALLLPVGIILTIKATTDSSLLDVESYLRKLERLTGILKKET